MAVARAALSRPLPQRGDGGHRAAGCLRDPDAGLLVQGLDSWLLWGVATAGNVAGSTLNWWLGRFALRFADRRWFPVSRGALERAQGWYRRWGQPSLLFSWLPGVGDAFTVAAPR